MGPTTKVCTACNTLKPLEEFHRHKSGKYGRHSECKACRTERSQKRVEGFDPSTVTATEKMCSRCNTLKPLEEFHRRKSGKHGRQTHCKACKAETSRAWYEANLERIANYGRTWYEANRDEQLAQARAKNARERGARVVLKVTAADEAAKLAYWGNRCAYCRTELTDNEMWHWDHVVPIKFGGIHALANLRPTCADCNLAKGASWPFNHPTLPFYAVPSSVYINEARAIIGDDAVFEAKRREMTKWIDRITK